VEEIVLKFGIPQAVLTDQGSNFMSEVSVNVCKLLKIKKIKCTAFHPQSNSALKGTHQVLVEYLRCFISEDQSNWDKWLPYATFVFNTTPHTSMGFTLHELLFGRKPNIPGLLQRNPPDTQYTYDNYVKKLQAHLLSSYMTARSNFETQKERSKEYHDRSVNVPLFVLGDKVLLHDERVRRGRLAKLSPPWIGPYEIADVDDVNVTLRLPRNRTLKVHANRMKPIFGYLQDHATTVAKALVEEIVLKFGIPQAVLMDQGSNFISEVFVNVCKLLKIKKIKCTVFNPQSNSALERTLQVLVEYLRLWTTFALKAILTPTTALDFTLQKFKESPGLYYDHAGEAQLYGTEWKLLTYTDLQEAD